MAFDPTALIGLGGSFLSAGANVAGSIIGSKLSLGKQKELAKYQADLNYQNAEKSARNSPSWNRAGLEKAGYNPMLAVQNATSGANSSWTSAQSANDPDLSGAISSGIANAQSFQRLKNETEQTESLTNKYDAEASEAEARKSEIVERLPYVSKQSKANYLKTLFESSKLENDIQYQNSYLEYLDNSLRLQDKLGMMGIYTTRRGQDLSYNASKYASDVAKFGHKISEINNIRTNRTNARRQGIRILGSGLDWYYPE